VNATLARGEARAVTIDTKAKRAVCELTARFFIAAHGRTVEHNAATCGNSASR
jgi:hypothetical protein